MSARERKSILGLIIAESFDNCLKPITFDLPRCLIPIAGIPLINYTIEFLATSGVSEIFVLCKSHHEKVIAHVNSLNKIIQTTCIKTNADNLGDAFRDNNLSSHLKRNVFIMVQGDVISNEHMKPILENHIKTMSSSDASQLLATLLVKENHFPLEFNALFEEKKKRLKNVVSNQETQLPNVAVDSTALEEFSRIDLLNFASFSELKIIVMDEDTGRLLVYEDKYSSLNNTKFSLCTDAFKSHHNLCAYGNVLASGITICSPSIFSHFEDHFDYKTMDQFIRGVMNDELEALTFNCSIGSKSGYACRVSSLVTYRDVCFSIMRRWTYPLVPDKNFLGDTNFVYMRPGYYLDEGVALDKHSNIGKVVLIGKKTKIGAFTKIRRSTIGRGCIIGSNVQIVDSFIWDNVMIENNCVIKNSVVASNVKLYSNTTLSAGCVVCSHVRIGPDVKLKKLTKLVRYDFTPSDGNTPTSDENLFYESCFEHDYQDDSQCALRQATRPIDLGSNGTGCSWCHPAIPFRELSTSWGAAILPFYYDKIAQTYSPCNGDDESTELASPLQLTDRENFMRGVEDSLKRVFNRDMDLDNVLIEVNSLKYAYDRSHLECAESIYSALANISNTTLPSKNIAGNFNSALTKFSEILKIYLVEASEQTEFIFKMEDCSSSLQSQFQNLFEGILSRLYDLEVLSEDAIFEWDRQYLESHDDDDDDDFYHRKCKTFLDWLKLDQSSDNSE